VGSGFLNLGERPLEEGIQQRGETNPAQLSAIPLLKEDEISVGTANTGQNT
jgi:hypothetical protein